MSVQEDYGDAEAPYSHIMYIDIEPDHTLYRDTEQDVLCVLLAISSRHACWASGFGRDIETRRAAADLLGRTTRRMSWQTPCLWRYRAMQEALPGSEVMEAGSSAEVIMAESDRMTR